jgi:hypothetical protein
VWFPYWIPYHVARIAEMRPALIVLAAMVAIAILVWKKPPHYYTLWCAAIIVGAILLVFLSDRRDRR